MPIKLSAVIITFNEEQNIERCIKSVQGVADEILVVDSFSSDKTKDIAVSLGAKFIEHTFEGHIQQKNWAKNQAEHLYVLSLDADEALDQNLKKSILKVKENCAADGYTFNRLTNYCGTWIKHGGWYPDKKLRLWNKTKGDWGGINPHDKFEMQAGSKIKHLDGDLLHYSYYSLKGHIKQVQKFTDITSKALFENGKKAPLFKILFSGCIRFFKGYLLQLGFLDGTAGYRIAKISAFAAYLKYAKLKELNDFARKEDKNA